MNSPITPHPVIGGQSRQQNALGNEFSLTIDYHIKHYGGILHLDTWNIYGFMEMYYTNRVMREVNK